MQSGDAECASAARCFVLSAAHRNISYYHSTELKNGTANFFQAAALWQVGVKLFLGHDGVGCNDPSCDECESLTENNIYHD